jgi:CRP-like cAMP-binding protein
VGPGAILGEGAIVQGGRRNATLRACTPARVAVIAADQIDRDALEALATGRRLDA